MVPGDPIGGTINFTVIHTVDSSRRRSIRGTAAKWSLSSAAAVRPKRIARSKMFFALFQNFSCRISCFYFSWPEPLKMCDCSARVWPISVKSSTSKTRLPYIELLLPCSATAACPQPRSNARQHSSSFAKPSRQPVCAKPAPTAPIPNRATQIRLTCLKAARLGE